MDEISSAIVPADSPTGNLRVAGADLLHLFPSEFPAKAKTPRFARGVSSIEFKQFRAVLLPRLACKLLSRHQAKPLRPRLTKLPAETASCHGHQTFMVQRFGANFLHR
jgi:hypothetical protein